MESNPVDLSSIEGSNSILKFANIVLAIGIISIILAPYILTRQTIFANLDFHETGQIGDTIGGITAPILSLVGSILVFLALKAQINANSIVMKQFNILQSQAIIDKKKEGIYRRIEIIRDDLKSFAHHESINQRKGNETVKTLREYTSTDAINTFFNFIYKEEKCDGTYDDIFMQAKHQQLEHIMSLIESIFGQIEFGEFTNEDKFTMKYYALHQYCTYLKPIFETHKASRSNKEVICSECSRFHKGISEKLFMYYDRIEAISSI